MATLSEYLTEKSIKQAAFAEQAGLSASYLSEIVSGKRTPSLRAALKIQSLTGGKVCMSSLLVSPSSTPSAGVSD